MKKSTDLKPRRVPAKKKLSPAAPKLAVSIDYPAESEKVRPGHYTVRITAPGATQVQARTGGGDWIECRESVGHFWLDWAPRTGLVRIAARGRAGKGRWTPATERDCVVAG